MSGSAPLPPSGDGGPSAPPERQAKEAGPGLCWLGDYELLEEIGRGGMGVVFRARQASLDRIVAVKMILAGPFASRDAIRRFQIEAKAAGRLRHPNIVEVHEMGESEGHFFFSMDYVPGQSLSALLASGPLPPQRAARYVQIGRAHV